MRISIIVSNTFVKIVFGYSPPSSEHEAKRKHKAMPTRASLLAYILGCCLLSIKNYLFTFTSIWKALSNEGSVSLSPTF